jgi:hypothetical protein
MSPTDSLYAPSGQRKQRRIALGSQWVVIELEVATPTAKMLVAKLLSTAPYQPKVQDS